MTPSFVRIAAAAALAAFVALPAQAQSTPPAGGMNPAKPMAPAMAPTMAPAQTMAPAMTPAQPMAAKKAMSSGQMAARERQKACSAEWKAAKAGGKMEPGMKWPKFWSECNTRLKAKSV